MKTARPKPIRVLIDVQGGCVQDVWSDGDIEVILQDWDNIKDDPDSCPDPLRGKTPREVGLDHVW